MRANNYLLAVGKKVQILRMERGITVRQLGELCQTDYSNLSRFENGQVNVRANDFKSYCR